MNSIKIFRPTLCGALILCMAVSCLQETILEVAVDFDCNVEGEYNTTPLTIDIANRTTGADTFEWTFEGGRPAASNEKNPGRVIFTEPGEHKVTLVARNFNSADSMTTIIRVDPAVTVNFAPEILVNDFAPVEVVMNNTSVGAIGYEWAFEGGEPATSNEKNPGVVVFREGGEHKILLKASNGSETFSMERTITLRPTLLCDFSMQPTIACQDREAPLTAILKNTSRSSLSVSWDAPGGIIADPTAEETTVLFEQPGTYTVTMTADNNKEQKSVSRQITVAPNSGIFTESDLHFGISQARNTIGCFFSLSQRGVLKSNEITTEEIGRDIEIGFFALNSSFDHCYFLSPDKARTSGFPAIPGARTTRVNNRSNNEITKKAFDEISTSSRLMLYNFDPDMGTGPGDQGDAFTLEKLPVFSFFITQDGRRGIVMIKDFVRNGAESYVVADMKIEK